VTFNKKGAANDMPSAATLAAGGRAERRCRWQKKPPALLRRRAVVANDSEEITAIASRRVRPQEKSSLSEKESFLAAGEGFEPSAPTALTRRD